MTTGRAVFHVIRGPHVDRIIGLALLAAVLAALAFSGFQQAQQNTRNACQQRVNTAFQTAITERAAETRNSNQALAALWDSLFRLKGTRAEQRAEFTRDLNDWKAKVTAVSPLPAPQSRTCG